MPVVTSIIACLLVAGQYQPAAPEALEPLFREALAERERELGPEHPKVARSARDLGMFIKSEALLRRSGRTCCAPAGSKLATGRLYLRALDIDRAPCSRCNRGSTV